MTALEFFRIDGISSFLSLRLRQVALLNGFFHAAVSLEICLSIVR